MEYDKARLNDSTAYGFNGYAHRLHEERRALRRPALDRALRPRVAAHRWPLGSRGASALGASKLAGRFPFRFGFRGTWDPSRIVSRLRLLPVELLAGREQGVGMRGDGGHLLGGEGAAQVDEAEGGKVPQLRFGQHICSWYVAQRAAVHAVAQTGGGAKTKHLHPTKVTKRTAMPRCCE